MNALNDIRFLVLTLFFFASVIYTIHKHYKVRRDSLVWLRIAGMCCLYIFGILVFASIKPNPSYMMSNLFKKL